MKKKSSIVKLSIIGVLIIIGLVLSFCTFNVGYSTYNSFTSSIKLGLDLKDGIYAVYEADSSVEDFDIKIDEARSGLFSLLIDKGYSGVVVRKEGTDKLRVEVPNFNDPSTLLTNVGKPAAIKFVVQSTSREVITSEHIIGAAAGYYDGSYIVSLELNRAGKRILTDHSSQTLNIITTIDGNEETRQSNIVNGVAYISSLSSRTAATNLADQILSGTLGVSLSLNEMSVAPASLGDRVAFFSLISALVAVVLIIAFVIFKYRLFGAVAAMNVCLYAVLMLFFLAVFPWIELSFAGIAAALVVAALILDGNIITFNRIKNEYYNGKSVVSSTHYGFKKALRAVVDSNVIVLLCAIVFLVFPTGSLRALGFVLLAGIVMSLAISLFVTRKLVKYFFNATNENAKAFTLVRAEAYAGLSASETAGEVQRQIDAELERKAMELKEKENSQDFNKGVAQDENN